MESKPMKIRQISRSGRIPEGMVRLDEPIDPDIALRMTWYPLQLHQGIDGSDLVYVYVREQDKANYDDPMYQQQYFRESKEDKKKLGKELAVVHKEEEARRKLLVKQEAERRQAAREELEQKQKLASLLELVSKGVPLSSLLTPSATERKRREKKLVKRRRRPKPPQLIVPGLSLQPIDWKRRDRRHQAPEKHILPECPILPEVLQHATDDKRRGVEILQEDIPIRVRNPVDIWLFNPLTLDQVKVYLIDQLMAQMIRYKEEIYIVVSERGGAKGFGKTLAEWRRLAAANYRDSFIEVFGITMPLPD